MCDQRENILTQLTMRNIIVDDGQRIVGVLSVYHFFNECTVASHHHRDPSMDVRGVFRWRSYLTASVERLRVNGKSLKTTKSRVSTIVRMYSENTSPRMSTRIIE